MKKDQENILDVLQQQSELEPSGKMHWIHWTIVILSVLLTIAAWQFSKRQLEDYNKKTFLRAANQVIEGVVDRMKLYESALWSGVANIDSQDKQLTYQQWYKYSQSLKIENTYYNPQFF